LDFELIYWTKKNNDELLTLLEVAREEIKRLGLTGMLLYQNGSFMQMLEAEKKTVLELFEKIKVMINTKVSLQNFQTTLTKEILKPGQCVSQI
jgi:hypothetical protein